MSQVPEMMQRAEQAMQGYDWDRAEQLYQEVLALAPNNTPADHGLRSARRGNEKEQELEERIAEADAQLAEGDYQGAARLYAGIMESAVNEPRILKFHTSLEQRLNRAKSLHIWGQRVQDALREARQLGEQEDDWQTAAEKAEGMLDQLPQEEAYQPLARDLQDFRAQALQQGDDKAVYRRALELLKAKEYEKGIEYLESIGPSSQDYQRVQRTLRQAERYLAEQEQDFAPIDTAIDDERWSDALAQLEKIRGQHEETPRWQRLFLRAGSACGRALLEEGRTFNERRNFEQAGRKFDSAKKVFAEILKIYPSHLAVQPLYDEAVDLTAIAGCEAKADTEVQNDERSAAIQALKLAQQRVERAESEGREYAAVGVMVETQLAKVEEEVRRIREEARNLRHAQSLWEQNHLTEARQRFFETLDALLPEHRTTAADGLSRVDAKIQEVKSFVEKGQAASDPNSAVKAYQEAYNLWAEGPGVAAALEDALVRACKAALESGHETQAVSYGKRALKLNPDNREAKRYVEKAGVGPEVESTVETVEGELYDLTLRDEIDLAELDALLARLEAVARKAEPWPDLRAKVEALHKKVQVQREKWARYTRIYERAKARRDTGEWHAAYEMLSEAIEALEDQAPAGVRRTKEQWGNAAEVVGRVRDELTTALGRAGEIYEGIAQAGELVEMGDGFSETLSQLNEARAAIRRAREMTLDAGGELPADIIALEKRVDELSTRAEAAAEAVRAPSSSDGLIRCQEIIEKRGEDSTLEAVRELLQEKAADEIDRIKQRAQNDIQAGDFTAALEKLSQVSQLDPEDTETANLYAELKQRQMLEDELRKINRDAEEKLNKNSPADAILAFQRGLELLLQPEVDVSPQVRDILAQLISLGKREDGLALGRDEHWDEAQRLTAELGQLRSENWAAGRAVVLVDRWIRLARDNALRGVVASSAELGELIDSYRAAVDYLKAHPQDGLAIRMRAEREEAIIDRLTTSVKKRISMARRVLADGDYTIALGNLEDIESGFYAEVEAEFPALLDGIASVQELRDEVETLKLQANKLKELAEEVQPHLDAAERAYMENDWSAAYKALKSLPSLKDTPWLADKAGALREKIEKGQVDAVRERLNNVLNKIETGKNLATTPKQLKDYIKELDGLQSDIDLQVLDVEERNRYFQLLSDVREQREALTAGALWEQEVEDYVEQEQYEDALKALDSALEVTRQAEKRVELEKHRREIERLVNEQRERALLLRQGQDLFSEEKYVAARQQLEKARQLGVDVEELMVAARAGALLQNARRFWEEDRDGEGALSDLDELAHLQEGNAYTQNIADDARRLRRKIEKAVGDKLKMQEALAEARRLMIIEGEFEAAQDKIQTVLKSDPGNSDALKLQSEIKQHADARKLLKQARVAHKEERHMEALEMVRAILSSTPELTEAKILRQRIEAALAMDQAIVQVELLAEGGQFKEARNLLNELAAKGGVSPEKLREMQDQIKELEAEQWNRIVRPIQDLHRRDEYSEALSRCRQALNHTATPELVQELENLQDLIVNKWVDMKVEALRKEFQGELREDKLREIESQIMPLLDLEPAPEAHRLRQLEELLKDTRTRRMRLRIDHARERYKTWQKEGRHGEPQSALGILKSVQDEVDDLGAQIEPSIAFDAASLENEIIDAIRKRDETVSKANFTELLSKAQRLQAQLRDPEYVESEQPGRAELEKALDLAEQARTISGFEENIDARDLEDWAQNALDAFDQTRKAMDNSGNFVRALNFNNALYELQSVGRVSLLLQGDYEEQRSLVSTLQQAERDQDNKAWELALDGYRQVLAQAPDLKALLNTDVERCYQRLFDQVRDEVGQALKKLPPDTKAARAALERANDAGWIEPGLEREYDELRKWLESQERVAQAAVVLQAEGDHTEARSLLQEALRLLPHNQSDLSIRQWEPLVEALAAWRRGNHEYALTKLNEVQPPVSEVERVKTLRAELEEAKDRTKLVARAHQRIEVALTARPARYEEAVQIMRQELGGFEFDPQVKELQREVRQPLMAELESQRKAGRYAKAIELGELLLRLVPHDEEVIDLVGSLPQERVEELERALREVEQAIGAYRISDGQNALQRAIVISEPEGDTRIDSLQIELRDLRTRLEKVRDGLRRVNGLAEQKQWKESVEMLMDVRRDAPRYKPVVETTRALQSSLQAQAETWHKAEEFARGIMLCEQALRLELNDEIQRLADRIRQDQESALVEVRQAVREGLDRWQLAQIPSLLAQGLKIAPEDDMLLDAQERYQAIEGMLPGLQTDMDRGWEALQKRDYPACIRAFREAMDRAPELSESQTWRDYARVMREAVRSIEDNNDYDQGVRYLREAEALVRVDPDTVLPDVFRGESHLKNHRRHAVYNAYRLRQSARKIAFLYVQSDEYYSLGNSESMEFGLDLLRKVESELGVFSRLHNKPSAPPDNFPVTGKEDEPLPDIEFKGESSASAPSAPPKSPELDRSPSVPGELEDREVYTPITEESDGRPKNLFRVVSSIFRPGRPSEGAEDDVEDIDAKDDVEELEGENTEETGFDETGIGTPSKPPMRSPEAVGPQQTDRPSESGDQEAEHLDESVGDQPAEPDELGESSRETEIPKEQSGEQSPSSASDDTFAELDGLGSWWTNTSDYEDEDAE